MAKAWNAAAALHRQEILPHGNHFAEKLACNVHIERRAGMILL
ncbi:hypothetical protein [Ensifer sp. 4252]